MELEKSPGEIDDKYLEREKKTTSIFSKVTKINKERMYRTNDVDYNIGDNIRHEDYGEGVVTAVDKKIITVAFPLPTGIKKFIKNHRSITKIS